jgi:hypothetical protein
MSEELDRAIDAINEPSAAPEFTPMPDAYAEPEKKDRTFGGDEDGLKKAASEVTERRAQEPEPIERSYVTLDPDSPEHGKPRPAHETLDIGRAADDLTRIRSQEAQGIENIESAVTAIETDAARAGVDPLQYVEQQQAQAQTQTIQPQSVDPGVPPEVAELQAELERSPKLRQALEQDIGRIQQAHQAAEQTKQQYAAATQQAYEFAIQSMVAAIPELQGVSVQEMPMALRLLKMQNPQRHAEAVTHLARVDQLGRAHQEAQRQQAQVQQQQLAHYYREQDARMDRHLATAERPEVVENVKQNVGRIARDVYGIDPATLAQAIQSTPVLRSFEFQRVLFDAARFHLAQQGVKEHRSNPVVPVQRPGTSQPRASYSDAEIAAARDAFTKNPTPQAAAAYLMAKRSARS